MSRSSKSKGRSKAQSPPVTEAPVAAPEAEANIDFLAPQDIVGDDLVAQLQTVLDEARAQLNDDPAVAATVRESSPAEASIDDDAFVDVDEAAAADVPWDDALIDDAMFESPAQVLGGSESMEHPAAAMVKEESKDFDAEIKQLMEMTGGEADQPASAADEAFAADSPAEDSIDATGHQADAVGAEVDRMSHLIEDAVAPAGSTETDQIIREIHHSQSPANRGVSAGAVSTPASAPAPAPVSTATMKRLDEFLADHADHAVADEFETIQDVLSQATAAQSPVTDATAPHSQATASQEDDDEFDSPEQLLQTDDAPFHQSEPHTSAPPHASIIAAGADGMAEADGGAAAGDEKPTTGLRMKTGGLLLAAKRKTYEVCRVLNRPLQNASASTRWNIGMIGLITLANASVLLLGKLFNFWG